MLLQCKRLILLALWTVGYSKMKCRLSPYDSHSCVGVPLIIGFSLNANVNFVLEDDKGRLVMADVAGMSILFHVAAVFAPNIAAEKVSFTRRLAPFLDYPKRIVLVGDWNAVH